MANIIYQGSRLFLWLLPYCCFLLVIIDNVDHDHLSTHFVWLSSNAMETALLINWDMSSDIHVYNILKYCHKSKVFHSFHVRLPTVNVKHIYFGHTFIFIWYVWSFCDPGLQHRSLCPFRCHMCSWKWWWVCDRCMFILWWIEVLTTYKYLYYTTILSDW